jgi:hypothetical protein
MFKLNNAAIARTILLKARESKPACVGPCIWMIEGTDRGLSKAMISEWFLSDIGMCVV